MASNIQLFKTTSTPCSYLEDRDSSNIVIDPEFQMTPEIYDFLLEKGFRRSGEMVYRPDCYSCDLCKSTRVMTNYYSPNRSQKRAWNKAKENLSVKQMPAEFNEKHYHLYVKYVSTRHPDGKMENAVPQQYMDFLTAKWSDTIFLELIYDNQLLAVAITDRQPLSLSALYTFFDPDLSHLSPGVLAIQAQIEHAKNLNLQWLYLGYWISECQKMSYKTQYKPAQVFSNSLWVPVED